MADGFIDTFKRMKSMFFAMNYVSLSSDNHLRKLAKLRRHCSTHSDEAKSEFDSFCEELSARHGVQVQEMITRWTKDQSQKSKRAGVPSCIEEARQKFGFIRKNYTFTDDNLDDLLRLRRICKPAIEKRYHFSKLCKELSRRTGRESEYLRNLLKERKAEFRLKTTPNENKSKLPTKPEISSTKSPACIEELRKKFELRKDLMSNDFDELNQIWHKYKESPEILMHFDELCKELSIRTGRPPNAIINHLESRRLREEKNLEISRQSKSENVLEKAVAIRTRYLNSNSPLDVTEADLDELNRLREICNEKNQGRDFVQMCRYWAVKAGQDASYMLSLLQNRREKGKERKSKHSPKNVSNGKRKRKSGSCSGSMQKKRKAPTQRKKSTSAADVDAPQNNESSLRKPNLRPRRSNVRYKISSSERESDSSFSSSEEESDDAYDPREGSGDMDVSFSESSESESDGENEDWEGNENFQLLDEEEMKPNIPQELACSSTVKPENEEFRDNLTNTYSVCSEIIQITPERMGALPCGVPTETSQIGLNPPKIFKTEPLILLDSPPPVIVAELSKSPSPANSPKAAPSTARNKRKVKRVEVILEVLENLRPTWEEKEFTCARKWLELVDEDPAVKEEEFAMIGTTLASCKKADDVLQIHEELLRRAISHHMKSRLGIPQTPVLPIKIDLDSDDDIQILN